MLVGDGQSVYMNRVKFDLQTGKTSAGTAPTGCLTVKPGKGNVAVAQIIWQHEPFESTRSSLTDGRLAAAVLASGADSSFGVSPPDKAGCNTFAKGAANWSVKLPGQGIALIVAGQTVYCAGVPADRDRAKRAQLVALAAADGAVIQSVDLETWPAIDGLSATQGRLYLAMQNGKVLCLGK